MSTLLLDISGSRTLNGTMWPGHLYVYDDLLIYRKRRFFQVREITISYHQISQVQTNAGIIFSNFEVITGEEKILIKWVKKPIALQGRLIINQKMYHSHAKHQPDMPQNTGPTTSYEKSLDRLKELLVKDQITEKEYNSRKGELLKNIK